MYYIVISYLLCLDSQHGMPNRTMLTCFRQAIYYSLLSKSGGNWSGSHRCSLLYFNSAVTIAHVVLISQGSVYYFCSQHLHRAGSSYQYIKTDPTLLIKISVILMLYLGVLVTISVIFLYFHITSLKHSYQL